MVDGGHSAKPRFDKPGGAVAINGSDEVNSLSAEFVHQSEEGDLLRTHVQGHGKGKEISDLLRMERGVDGGQQATKAVAEQGNLICLFTDLHRSDYIGQVAIDIGVKSPPAI